jgi:hypothetical protein
MPTKAAAAKPALKEKTLPPIVRDYIEHVRGRPEMTRNILPDYLDSLWREAANYSKRYSVPSPIGREEIEDLRLLVETRGFARGFTQKAS